MTSLADIAHGKSGRPYFSIPLLPDKLGSAVKILWIDS